MSSRNPSAYWIVIVASCATRRFMSRKLHPRELVIGD